jgi:hypothetical protein
MRIWDIPPEKLCRVHLLAEHRELHGLWVILTQGKKGYANHPETKRWHGKLKALFLRHELLVAEMLARGYAHHTHLDSTLAVGADVQDVFVDTPEAQVSILREKGCECRV